jgi:hypothetical protein
VVCLDLEKERQDRNEGSKLKKERKKVANEMDADYSKFS